MLTNERTQFVKEHPAIKDDKVTPEFYKELIDVLKPRLTNKELAFIVVAHQVHTLPYFVEALSQLGKIAAIIPKSSSTVLEVKQSLSKIYGSLIKKNINKFILESNQKASESFLTPLIEDKKYQNHQFIIVDHGGYFSARLQDTLIKFKDKIIGIVEHTWNGELRYRNHLSFPIPIRSIARTHLKSQENKAVAQSIVFAIQAKIFCGEGLNQVIHHLNHIAIIGYGHIGRNVAKILDNYLKQNHAKTKLHICDLNNGVLEEAAIELPTASITQDKSSFISKADLIIVATSSQSLTRDDFKRIKADVCLVCGTSRDDLLKDDALDDYEKVVHPSPNSIVAEYRNKDNPSKKIYLASDGGSVNFIIGSTPHPILHGVLASVCFNAYQLVQQHIIDQQPIPQEVIASNRKDDEWVEHLWEKYYGSLIDYDALNQCYHTDKIKTSNTSTIVCYRFLTTNPPATHTLFFIPDIVEAKATPHINEIEALHLSKNLNCNVIVIFPRISLQNQYPTPINDIVNVINHYIDNKDKFSIDTQHIALSGYSMGCLLACQICILALKSSSFFNYLLLMKPIIELERNKNHDANYYLTQEKIKSYVPEHLDIHSPLFSITHGFFDSCAYFPDTIILESKSSCVQESAAFRTLLNSKREICHSYLLDEEDYPFWSCSSHILRISEHIKTLLTQNQNINSKESAFTRLNTVEFSELINFLLTPKFNPQSIIDKNLEEELYEKVKNNNEVILIGPDETGSTYLAASYYHSQYYNYECRLWFHANYNILLKLQYKLLAIQLKLVNKEASFEECIVAIKKWIHANEFNKKLLIVYNETYNPSIIEKNDISDNNHIIITINDEGEIKQGHLVDYETINLKNYFSGRKISPNIKDKFPETLQIPSILMQLALLYCEHSKCSIDNFIQRYDDLLNQHSTVKDSTLCVFDIIYSYLIETDQPSVRLLSYFIYLAPIGISTTTLDGLTNNNTGLTTLEKLGLVFLEKENTNNLDYIKMSDYIRKKFQSIIKIYRQEEDFVQTILSNLVIFFDNSKKEDYFLQVHVHHLLKYINKNKLPYLENQNFLTLHARLLKNFLINDFFYKENKHSFFFSKRNNKKDINMQWNIVSLQMPVKTRRTKELSLIIRNFKAVVIKINTVFNWVNSKQIQGCLSFS